MGVKTYQAYTMAEALDAAKRDLGADAVVLETRTFTRGGFLGLGKRPVFELTATTADRVDLSGARREPRRAVPRAARAAYARDVGAPAPDAPRPPAVSDGTRTRRLAQALAERHERHQRDAVDHAPHEAEPGSRTPLGRHDDPDPGAPGAAGGAAVALAAPPADAAVLASPRQAAGVARRFILTPAATETAAAPEPEAVAIATAPGRDEPAAPPGLSPATVGGDMQVELAAIKAMVGQVLQRQPGARGPDPASMPARLFGMYLELVAQDLSEELAERIVNGAREAMAPAAWEDEHAVREAVLSRLAEFVPTADPIIPRRSPDDRPLTIALIGPTGVGKTTTLAKLAASFKLREQKRVGLVTCDTYRIAAVDQLRTYANIMGLELQVALTPAETRRAVGSLRDCDVILIDTAGRGANDTGRIDELLQCLRAADPHEVHLVLSSTASEKSLLGEAEAFARAGANRIVLTKLDEAVSFGVLINVMQKIGKKLSFITTGQEVPDHIEAGEPRRLAGLVLGAEVHA